MGFWVVYSVGRKRVAAMAKRPTGRTKYYSSKSTGVKRGEEALRSVQQPKKPTKPVDQRAVANTVRAWGKPNRNAPVRPIYWTRKKSVGRSK